MVSGEYGVYVAETYEAWMNFFDTLDEAEANARSAKTVHTEVYVVRVLSEVTTVMERPAPEPDTRPKFVDWFRKVTR